LHRNFTAGDFLASGTFSQLEIFQCVWSAAGAAHDAGSMPQE